MIVDGRFRIYGLNPHEFDSFQEESEEIQKTWVLELGDIVDLEQGSIQIDFFSWTGEENSDPVTDIEKLIRAARKKGKTIEGRIYWNGTRRSDRYYLSVSQNGQVLTEPFISDITV